jgi:peptidoglycan/LPS O-acetylase OafA/YrhL
MPPGCRPHITGFDALRLLAMACVTVQHGLSVIGHYEWTQITPGCTLGQFGVAAFCGLAGWFAIEGRQGPATWMAARLLRLFPAYWAATLLAFALALAIGRPVTAGLFSSQMLGLGYFTHGMDLVNVVSWFISLILLCYALTALARLSRWPRLGMAVFSVGALALILSGVETVLARHVLTFTVAAVIAASGGPRLALVAGAIVALAAVLQPGLLVASVALILLWLFQAWVRLPVTAVEVMAAYTYEYFLLHGLFLQAGARLVAPSATGLMLGLLASVPAVMLLKRCADAVAARMRLRLGV